MLFQEETYKFMYAALQEAETALEDGEIPIGAVVVYKNKIIGRGYNRTDKLKDPTAHAEILAITSAANNLRDKFLTECDIYITAEPCVMCTGAILLSRINKVYFGAYEPKFGACGSLYNIIEESKYNHKPEVYSGILAEEAKTLLIDYFKEKRNRK